MTAPTDYFIGQDAILTVAAASIGIASNVSASFERSEVAGNYRDSLWESVRAGQKKGSGSFTMRRKPSDSGYAAVFGAWESGAPVALTMTNVTGGSEEVNVTVVITKFDIKEDMDAFQTVDVGWKVNTSTAPTSPT